MGTSGLGCCSPQPLSEGGHDRGGSLGAGLACGGKDFSLAESLVVEVVELEEPVVVVELEAFFKYPNHKTT